MKKGNFFKTKRETIHFIVGMFASTCIFTAIAFLSFEGEPTNPHSDEYHTKQFFDSAIKEKCKQIDYDYDGILPKVREMCIKLLEINPRDTLTMYQSDIQENHTIEKKINATKAIQKITNHCNVKGERTDIHLGYSNDTHMIDNTLCEWIELSQQKIDAWLECTSKDHVVQESYPAICYSDDKKAWQPIIEVGKSKWNDCISSENAIIFNDENPPRCIFSNDVVYHKTQ